MRLAATQDLDLFSCGAGSVSVGSPDRWLVDDVLPNFPSRMRGRMSDLLSDLYRRRSDERHLNPTYRLVPWWGLQGVNDRLLAHDPSMGCGGRCIRTG